jgi:hypothetical protein
MNHEKIYYIPARFRRVENMHILLWLIKDACWAMNFKSLGLFMIVPTLSVALIITWQTRRIVSESLHNLAVVFWIIANCIWMIGEFTGWDENLVGSYGLRQFSLIPFGIGLLILLYYYIFLASKKGFQEKMFERTNEIILKELGSTETLS